MATTKKYQDIMQEVGPYEQEIPTREELIYTGEPEVDINKAPLEAYQTGTQIAANQITNIGQKYTGGTGGVDVTKPYSFVGDKGDVLTTSMGDINLQGGTKAGRFFRGIGKNVKNTTKVFKKGAWKAMDVGSKAGAMSTASAVLNMIPVSDNDPSTYTGAEIGKDVANLALNAAMLSNPLTFVQGAIGMVSTIGGGIKKIFDRKKIKEDIAEEEERIDKENIANLQQRQKDIRQQQHTSRLQAEQASEEAGLERYNRTAKHGARINEYNLGGVANDYFSQDFLKYKNLMSGGGRTYYEQGGDVVSLSMEGTRPSHLKYEHFDKGGYTSGPSHEQGGIPGFIKGGGAVELEGNEMVFSQKDSKKIESLKKNGNTTALGKYISKAMDKWPGGWQSKTAYASRGGSLIPSGPMATDTYVHRMLQDVSKTAVKEGNKKKLFSILKP